MNKAIETEFDVIRQRGHEAVLSIEAPEAQGEWGIRVVLLDESNDGNHKVAFRTESPMTDGDWQLGTLEDASDALAALADEFNEFLTA